MASILFSTVGQAIGGPLGLAVGAVIGGSLDSILFGPRGKTVSDIFVQQSAYGNVVPRIYGRTRASGQLIWALPWSAGSGRMRGQARTATTSFAVALSSGPIAGIGRIWADGREIRDADGTFEVPTVMRVYKGAPGQEVDPLVLSVEGAAGTPDFRGLAYVVFENIDLSVFGNRIPNLSFEIFADEDGPAEWLSDYLSGTDILVRDDGAERNAVGYSVFGDGAEEVRQISEISGLVLSLVEGQPIFGAETGMVALQSEGLLIDQSAMPELQYLPKPSGIAVTYLDPERDYQAGQQRVDRGRSGTKVESEAPVCSTAVMALSMARRLLQRLEAGSEVIQVGLPWRQLGVSVGDHILLDGRGPWRILEREVRGFGVFVKAERLGSASSIPAAIADSGRSLGGAMVPVGATSVRLFESPVPLKGTGPSVFAWVSGERGWRGAGVELINGSESRNLGEVTRRQPFGTLINELAPGPIQCWDDRNDIILSIDKDSVQFESRSREDVLNGANIALVGSELIQYCDVDYIDEQTVKLSALLRGRFGTEPAHTPQGGSLYGIDVNDLIAVNVSPDDIGRNIVVLAAGVGDQLGGVEASLAFDGAGAGVMAPVHLRGGRRDDGGLWAEWAPRARELWEWNLTSEQSQSWICTYSIAGVDVISLPVSSPRVEISAADQIAAIGHLAGSGTLRVETLGLGPRDLKTAFLEMN